MKWPQELINKGNAILESIDWINVEPSRDNALRFFNNDPDNISVVIIGQDPYPTKGVANGIAFAVNEDIKEPQSLKNIFREIIEVRGSLKADKTLKHWEDQGVLLLNKSLTVKVGEPNSHKGIWKDFTDEVIRWIDDNLKVTWVLWGNEAKVIKGQLKNNVVIDAHPSPLSVRHRNKNTFKQVDWIDW